MTVIFVPNENAMLALGARLAQATEAGAVIFLEGLLGAGKTTFARGFLRALGWQGKIKSPTYTLVEPYEIQGRKLFHFDFYRVQDPDELKYIGLQEYFIPTAICLIEWPENGFPFLPTPDLICRITFNNMGRDVHIESKTGHGEAMLEKM